MSKQKYFPLKPETEEGFKDPVSWLGGRELVTSLKGMIIYALYGESIDPRPWMKPGVYPKSKGLTGNETPDQIKKAADNAVYEEWIKKNEQYREWKKERFEFWQTYYDGHSPQDEEEFWFDYIADSGDGQLGGYGVACLCLSDLWAAKDEVDACVSFDPYPGATSNDKKAEAADSDIGIESEPGEEKILLPRGSFLFVGGDTAYHVADYSSIHERFQLPFRWAFASVRKFMIEHLSVKSGAEKYFINNQRTRPIRHLKKTETPFNSEWDGTMSKVDLCDSNLFWDTEPLRPLFGLPANHDYYDDLDGFNRQFRRPPLEKVEENKIDHGYADNILLKIPTFRREQETSYTALRLPFGWWFLGVDSENEKLDFRQKAFFNHLMEEEKPKKVIIATPEPTTVFGQKCDPEEKTAKYLDIITKPIGFKQPFLTKGQLKPTGSNLEKGGYCRLDLSGDVHHYARYWGPRDSKTPPNKEVSDNYASLVSGGGGAFFDSTATMVGDLIPDPIFPNRRCSIDESADRILDLSNIRKGGYIQIVGAVIAVLILFCVVVAGDSRDFFGSLWDRRKWGVLGTSGEWVGFGMVLMSTVFWVLSWWRLHSLNKRLNAERNEDTSSNDNGRIVQLKWPLIWFTVGIAVYLIFIWQNWPPGADFLKTLHLYAKSVLLLLHIIAVILLFTIGSEYLNWLPLRFKFMRKSGAVPESWLALIFRTSDKKIDRFLGGDNLIKRLWEAYKKKSVENFPIFTINLCAVAILGLGIYLFGSDSLYFIGANLLLTLLVVVGIAGLYFLAVSLGAHYHRGTRKYFSFGALGAWHAIVQLSTPFILVYWGDWWAVVSVIVLSIIMNGFSGVHTALKFVWPDIDAPDARGWKKILHLVVTVRFGAWIMKKDSPALFFVIWLMYGAAVLAAPWLVRLTGRQSETVYESAFSLTRYLTFTVPGGFFRVILFAVAARLPYVILLVVAGYLGYRMSRVWASWYFAVALTFNGHNNEAGGAARIQGFKHILRIKVTEKELTVYVIGFDDPKPELEQLRPRLVDKFTLKCKDFPPPPAAPDPAAG